MTDIPPYQIRASFDALTIRIYQAYNDQIADSALANGRFVSPPFKRERMTWIKPSFLWMMYRAGWGLKDPDQSRILAIDITREGFDWALEHSCSTHREPSISEDEWRALKAASPVRIQWDPERNLLSEPQNHRSIQVGLGKDAAALYVDRWIQKITDITEMAKTTYELVRNSEFRLAQKMLPIEEIYPYSGNILPYLKKHDMSC
ncbi:DUF4291 domain-containing protein [Gluconacetobacter liquefaciens]|uniref:DUF4291 domain-containing protein n=1 Tax=Gluconacetobacter liquefaciens TaxID=89584 RepID=A0A7W4JPA6_GLULI|nr:DUF4291 domain-containing protein [Gluconacetobacter liquefaciens]MBB2188302.1 DUF4291 domain-containing protein [Gluconacetobacter liquefaciens]